MRRTLWVVALVLLTTRFAAAAEDAPAKAADRAADRAVDRAAADVSLIAAWLTGSDDAKAFARPFGDREWITRATDAVFYSDVETVAVPRSVKRVPYDLIKARMERIRNGHKADPAVLITRSVAENPDEGTFGAARVMRKANAGERYYYVEVAIGNMAWHWIKVAVREVEGKPKAEILCSAVS